MTYSLSDYKNDIKRWEHSISNDTEIQTMIMNECIPSIINSEYCNYGKKKFDVLGFVVKNYKDIFKYETVIGRYPELKESNSDISSSSWILKDELFKLCNNTGVDDIAIDKGDLKILIVNTISEFIEKYPNKTRKIYYTGEFIKRSDDNYLYSISFILDDKSVFHLQIILSYINYI